MFLLSDEVAMAIAAGRAVVGLETSVIGQGLPYPRNLECIERTETAIRGTGATPGWVGLVDAEPDAAVKVARRDVPVAVASGSLGATTVSATIWAAHRAGIGVAATGGIGGVHPGPRPDVSADLLELGRTPIVLIASGPKSIVDPVATAEKLEELGVALVGYGVDRLPFFLAREAPVELEDRVETPEGAAAIARAHRALGAQAAIVLCNPIAPEHALDPDALMAATARAEARMEEAEVAGKAVTPFVLRALAEETGGRSLEANLVLLEDNARLAAEVALAISAATSGR